MDVPTMRVLIEDGPHAGQVVEVAELHAELNVSAEPSDALRPATVHRYRRRPYTAEATRRRDFMNGIDSRYCWEP